MRILFITIIMFCAAGTHAQSIADSNINKYIKIRRYIQLTDTTHLPQSVKPFYNNILTSLAAKQLNVTEWFIPPGGVRDEPYFIIIRLDHIQSIKARAAYLDQGPIAVKDAFVGNRAVVYDTRKPLKTNPSGLDREVSINKLSGVSAFKVLE